jgi:GTP-binding protein
VCDVPGLIEGAHKGKGLGDTFLKHIERCGSIVHLLDASRITLDPETIEYDVSTIINDYKTIRHELESYSPLLNAKKELIILSKIDLIPEADRAQVYKNLKEAGLDLLMGISSATHEGIEDFKKKLIPFIEKTEEIIAKQDSDEQVILQPHLARVDDMKSYQVVQADNTITITGKRFEQLTEMTDPTQRGSIMRWQDVCKRIGLTKELNRIDKNHECKIIVGNIDATNWRTGTINLDELD